MLTHNYKAHSFSVLIFALLFSVSFSSSDQGSENEKKALLSFRANSDSSNSLSSWLKSSNPCSDSWFGVSCDSATGRVTKLVLENIELSGTLEPLSKLGELRHLSLKNNSVKSTANSSLNLSVWPNLKHLYLSRNRFAEKFPVGVSRLRRLQRLDLSENNFSGEIPMAALGRLPRLLTLRLESNLFSGGVEESNDSSFSFRISDFNVSRNNLSGEIPNWLRRFEATSFVENDGLCGKPLPKVCEGVTTNQTKPQAKSEGDGMSGLAVASIVVLVAATATIVAGVLGCCWRRKRSTWRSREANKYKSTKMVVLEGCGKRVIDDVEGLLRASAEMIGKGSVGTTYKVAMDGGDFVAVKRVKVASVAKEVDWWLRQVLGNLRHPNIATLTAYYRSQKNDLLLLVYEYFPRGSLHFLLHGNRGPGRTPMDWGTRLKLASDSARGLAFLHDPTKKMKLFHGHLTSENILVDAQGNGCVADAGLHQCLRGTDSWRGSDYTAPEIAIGTTPTKYTHKCDVYSFGVVLLEILTGKMAAEEGLVDWVRSVTRGEWSAWDVLDVEVLGTKHTADEMVALLQVAILCLAPLPNDRPAMSAVYTMIEDIRTKGARDSKGHAQTRSVMDDFLDASSSPE